MPAENARRTLFATVTDLFSSDHDRLDAILEAVTRLVQRGEHAAAVEALRPFASGLRRHIRAEEDVLFGLFEARTGARGGPSFLMRHEHAVLLRALGDMERALADGRVDRFHEARDVVDLVLPDHNRKEEKLIFPVIDRGLAGAELDEIIARLDERGQLE